MDLPLLSEKLTKQFLMSLPDGVYLVSNVAQCPGQPIFAEIVLAAADREAQWNRITAARVDRQLCNVFCTPEDYIQHSLTVRYPRERN